VKIVGWSGTQAVVPGSRFLWTQRYASSLTRVTTTPSKPGEYRARRLTVDTAPTTGPTAADGFRIDSGSGIAAGRINQYDVYIGPGKVVQIVGSSATGRSGGVSFDYTSATTSYGSLFAYDTVTGVASIYAPVANAGDCCAFNASFSSIATAYFDILVADDPVPVGIAPAVHVEASDTSGQAVTANTTNFQYSTELYDSHNAWSGSLFTCPVAGVYAISASSAMTTAVSNTNAIYKNGSLYRYGNNNGSVAFLDSFVSTTMRLVPGDTIAIRSSASLTRSTTVGAEWISITRVSD
jgi:hypothetical protein